LLKSVLLSHRPRRPRAAAAAATRGNDRRATRTSRRETRMSGAARVTRKHYDANDERRRFVRRDTVRKQTRPVIRSDSRKINKTRDRVDRTEGKRKGAWPKRRTSGLLVFFLSNDANSPSTVDNDMNGRWRFHDVIEHNPREQIKTEWSPARFASSAGRSACSFCPATTVGGQQLSIIVTFVSASTRSVAGLRADVKSMTFEDEADA